MKSEKKLTLKVVEIIHYSLDVDASIEFYSEKLGWPVIYEQEGGMALIDVGGVYQLCVFNADWKHGWNKREPLPQPMLAMESKNLRGDAAILVERGLDQLEIRWEPASIVCGELVDPEGIKIYIWQDSVEEYLTKAIQEYKTKSSTKPLYSLGECIFFVNDLKTEECFYKEKLGFEVKERHDFVYVALRIGEGPVLGLYNWSNWWDKPTTQTPDAAVRLFLECPDIDKEYSRLDAAAVEMDCLRATDDGLHWFSISDPDGNLITFWQFKTR